MSVALPDAIDNYIQRLVRRDGITGLAIAIIEGEEIKCTSFGNAVIEPPKKFTPDTIIPLGSLSKSLTAAAVAQLVHDERYPEVRWESLVADLLPGDFVLPEGAEKNVTLGMILSHRSGMPPHEFSPLKSADCASITRNLRNLPMLPPPDRGDFVYCNMMYTVASYLVEQKSGVSFAEFLQNHIFDPLHMHQTCLFSRGVAAERLAGDMASGYQRRSRGQYPELVPPQYSPETQGASEVYCSVSDFGRFLRAMLRHAEKPITKEIYQDLVRNHVPCPSTDADLPTDEDFYYALGWEADGYAGETVISHSGGGEGYRALALLLPDCRFGCVVFTNSDHGDTTLSKIKFCLLDWKLDGILPEYTDDGDDDGAQWSEADSFEDLADGVPSPRQAPADVPSPRLDMYEPPPLPLSAYGGDYWHAGYGRLTVQAENQTLYIDAKDRSAPFTASLAHVSAQRLFSATLRFGPCHPDVTMEAEFALRGGRAVRLGLELEEYLDGYIWFDRIE